MNTGTKRVVFLLAGWLFLAGGVAAQTCNQPGALLSVRNTVQEPFEYIVFTFVDPYEGKGSLFPGDRGPFTQLPLNNIIRVRGDQYYKITFPNVRVMCDTKQYTQVPQTKVMDIKQLQQSDGIITYIIGLRAGAQIRSHIAVNYHGFHIVKLQVQ